MDVLHARVSFAHFSVSLFLLMRVCSRGSVRLEVTGRVLSPEELEIAHRSSKALHPPPRSSDEDWLEIRVCVRDTGVGISEENIKKLFRSVGIWTLQMRASGGASETSSAASLTLLSSWSHCRCSQFSQVHPCVGSGTGLGQ